MIGDNIRRKPRPMTERARALHQYFLSHPNLVDEGEGVLSIEFEANAEAEALKMTLNDFLVGAKILFGNGIIRDTEFEDEGEKLFYKHYLYNPDLFNN